MTLSSRNIVYDKYTHLVQISNQNALIIEIGRSSTKVGYVGETAPRAIINTPAIISQIDDNFENFVKSEKVLVSDFLFDIYKRLLKTSPQNHKLLFVEDVSINKKLYERIIQCLFVDLRVPVICSLPGIALIPFATGGLNKSHVIVDVGYTELKIYPLLYPSMIEIKGIDFSTSSIKSFVNELQSKYPELSTNQAKDIIDRASFVYNDSNSPLQSDPSTDLNYRTSGFKQTKIKQKDRNLFKNFFNLDDNLTQKIVKSIKNCPIDCRHELMTHVVLIGGGANIPGLASTLKSLLPPTFKLIEPRCNPSVATWLGGSLYGCSKINFDKFALLRDAYINEVYNNMFKNENDDKENEDKNFQYNELTENDLFNLTQKVHDKNENFLPVYTEILPNILMNNLKNEKFDKVCLTLAQVMEFKKQKNYRSNISSLYSSRIKDKKSVGNVKDNLKELKQRYKDKLGQISNKSLDSKAEVSKLRLKSQLSRQTSASKSNSTLKLLEMTKSTRDVDIDSRQKELLARLTQMKKMKDSKLRKMKKDVEEY